MKRKSIKSALAALFSMGVLLGSYSCSGNNSSCATTSDSTLIVVSIIDSLGNPNLQGNFQWEVVSIGGNEVQAVESGPYLMFDTINQTITGNAGCNVFNATYFMDTVTAQSITIQPVQVTMAACPDLNIEQTFLEVLPTVTAYEITVEPNDTTSTLSLHDKSGKNVLKLKKAPQGQTSNSSNKKK